MCHVRREVVLMVAIRGVDCGVGEAEMSEQRFRNQLVYLSETKRRVEDIEKGPGVGSVASSGEIGRGGPPGLGKV